jgi:Type VI secretion system, TssR
MIRSFVLLCVGLILFAGTLWSQPRAMGMKVFVRPSEYHSAPYRILAKSDQSKTIGGVRPWVVCSDRESNPTYLEPDTLSQVVNRLKYLQTLFVVGETDEFIQVVAFEKEAIDLNTNTLTKDVASFGWIPKTKALLWMHSMVDAQTKFARKCLAVNSIRTLSEIGSYVNNDKLILYTRPGGKNPTEAHVMLYNFVFIFKEEGDYYLVGKKMNMVEGSIQNDLLGWVSKEIVQPWSHRVALEPLAEGAGYEREGNGTPVRVFTSQQDAANYANGGYFDVNNLISFDDKFAKPLKANVPRLPILEEVSKEPLIYYTGVVTPVFNSSNEQVMTVEQQSVINEQYEIVRKDRSNVNIVFVVDGSEYMRRYTRPISTAIRKATNLMKQFETNTTFEYGAVIYRSASEKSCGISDIESKDITSAEESIIKFLTRDVVRDDCTAKNEYRSVYRGVKKGIDMLSRSDRKNQTNIIILIGAKGNDDADYNKKEELARELAKLNCSLMVFQVTNIESEESYQQFYQGIDYAIKQSEKFISEEHQDIWPKVSDLKFDYAADNEHALRMPFPKEAPVPGSLVWTDPGIPMSAPELEAEIKKVILGCVENNDRLFAKGDAHTRGMGKRVVMDEAVRNMLRQMDVEIDQLKLASYENIQFFWQGYTPMKRAGNLYNFYQYVILVSDAEVRQLMKNLENLIGDDGLSLSEQRDFVEAAFKSLAKTLLGAGESKSKVDIMTMGSVLDKLYGVPGFKRDGIFNTEIKDVHLLSTTQIEVIQDHIRDCLKKIDEFIGMNKFENFSEVYYWLPQSVLP